MVRATSTGRLKSVLKREFPDDWVLLVLFTLLSPETFPTAEKSLLTASMILGITAPVLVVSGGALLYNRIWGWLLMVLLYLPLVAIFLVEGRYASAALYGLMAFLCWQYYRKTRTNN